MITIIDYDAGNVGSVLNCVTKAGGKARLSAEPGEIAAAEKLILPGVGHFGSAVERLENRGLTNVIRSAVLERKVPFLGICLGMQLLLDGSEEAPGVAGLGLVSGRCKRFSLPNGSGLKVPHMGWNEVTIKQTDDAFVARLPDEPRFYFVHTFHAVCHDDDDVLMMACHGYEFVAAVHRDNIWGTQFHPEKSHKFGLALIRNFVGLSSASC